MVYIYNVLFALANSLESIPLDFSTAAVHYTSLPNQHLNQLVLYKSYV